MQTMFPYSHMTREELLTRAELEGDGLSRALARELDLSEEERLSAEAGEKEAKEEAEERADETRDAERLADECGEERDELADERDNLLEERARILALIPSNTKHKGLLAIRAALENA